ncbi:hypothetical protein [Bradyrhizobium sp. USDA 4504]
MKPDTGGEDIFFHVTSLLPGVTPSRLLKKGGRRRPRIMIHWLRRDSEMVRARRRQSNGRAVQLRRPGSKGAA